MKPIRPAVSFAVILVLIACHVSAQPASPASTQVSTDPEKAWAEIEQAPQALRAPETWRQQKPDADELAKFQKQIRATANAFADKAQYFLDHFPTNEQVAEARFLFIHALNHAVAAGDTNAEQRISSFVEKVVADAHLPENEKAQVLLVAGNKGFMKTAGMRVFTEGFSGLHEESELALVEATRAGLQRFPSNSMLYTMLVSVADRSKGQRRQDLAAEILKAPGAPAEVRSLAQHIVSGTRPYQLGQPLDIHFRALDGREVDLAKLKGKVVLVDFWSTDCGPCVAEMPAVKEAYEKLHSRGFEVIGISLDDNEKALRRFIEEKALPWPQHFDGKSWENKFALRYGIFGIPTMWLVDKRGNLSNTGARGNLEAQVNSLLQQ